VTLTVKLTSAQQEALDHAREVLAELPPGDSAQLAPLWYAEMRRTLAAVVEAFAEDC